MTSVLPGSSFQGRTCHIGIHCLEALEREKRDLGASRRTEIKANMKRLKSAFSVGLQSTKSIKKVRSLAADGLRIG